MPWSKLDFWHFWDSLHSHLACLFSCFCLSCTDNKPSKIYISQNVLGKPHEYDIWKAKTKEAFWLINIIVQPHWCVCKSLSSQHWVSEKEHLQDPSTSQHCCCCLLPQSKLAIQVVAAGWGMLLGAQKEAAWGTWHPHADWDQAKQGRVPKDNC